MRFALCNFAEILVGKAFVGEENEEFSSFSALVGVNDNAEP